MAEPLKKVVIVEDEPDTAEMFAEMMRLSGYQVFKCYGGTAAMELIEEHKPDAVILDVMMPDLSGLDVLRKMRQDPEMVDIPVVVASAKSLPSDIQAGLDAGASAYLTKPVTYQEFSQAVQTTIDAAEKK
jgi:DNA-binding response OmpR family regulator